MPTAAAEVRLRRTTLVAVGLTHAAFVPTGMITVMLGPLLPMLASRWSLNDTRAGYLITTQFFGALVGTISSSLVTPWLGFRRAVAAGQILMALGTASLLLGGFRWALAAIFMFGMGIGLMVPTGNLLVAAVPQKHRSSTLSLLNLCWSAGAVSAPFLLSAVQAIGGTRTFLYGISALLIFLAILVFPGSDTLESGPQPTSSSQFQRHWVDYLSDSAALILGLLFFIYVGTETALGAWLASYAKRVGESSVVLWMSVPSFFYGALLLGRAVSPITLRYLSDARHACIGVGVALLSCGALMLSRSVASIAICAFFAGFGFSTLYPIAVSFLSSTFGSEASRIGGAMFALSTLGGASVPWLVGFASTQFHSLRTALLVPFFGCALMLFLFFRPRWRRVA